MRSKTIFAGARAAAAVLLLVVGGYLYFSRSKSEDTPVASPASASLFLGTTTLSTLLAAYKDNEVHADATYKGNSIEVTGIVGDVKKDILDEPYIIVGTGRELEVPTVQCSLAASAVDRATWLHKGDAVTVRGTVTGLLFNVQLKDCVITR